MKTWTQVTLQFQYVIWDDIETSYVKCLGIVDIGSHAAVGYKSLPFLSLKLFPQYVLPMCLENFVYPCRHG